MTQNLNNFLKAIEHKKHATTQGIYIHKLLQQIVIDDSVGVCGDEKLVSEIQARPDLHKYFVASAKTEVPIAGILNGVFVSKRIDRLVIDKNNKTVEFLDYKTDLDFNTFNESYKQQLTEYAQLLHSAYPEYRIFGAILWVKNWQLENIISL